MPARSRFTLAAAALPLFFAASALAEPGVRKGPYLQHLGTTSVSVRIELAAQGPASVDITTEGKPKRTISDVDPRFFHDFRVTGLEAQTHYRYVVHGGAANPAGEFTTAPKDDSVQPFTFLVYGDNRTDPSAHAAVVHAILQVPSDFLLHTGDFVEVGPDGSMWQQFFDIEAPLLRNRSIFACVGNHELYQDAEAAAFERYFGPSDDAPQHLYGSFRWGSTRFFLLNAFHDWSSGDERAWLEAELGRADNEPGLRWRVAVVHHGPFSAGHHGPNERLDDAHVPELLAAHKVDLVIAGHDHIYERGLAMGLRYLISGGGGAPLYRDIRPLPSTRKVEAAYHYVLVTVSPDKVQLVAKRADGSALDACGFGHGPGWDCDPAAAAPPPLPTPTVFDPAPPPSEPKKSKAGCQMSSPSGGSGLAPAALALALLCTRRSRARASG